MSRSLFRNIAGRVSFPDLVKCRGCGDEFPSARRSTGGDFHSLEYYIHCVQDCEQYKALGEFCYPEKAADDLYSSQICSETANLVD